MGATLSIGTSECDNARMDAVIRRARESDASFVAWTQQTAARSHLERGFWDVAIPGLDAPRLELISALARSQPEAFCHWKRFLIAEVDGAPAAALSGYEPARHGGAAFIEALAGTLRRAGWSNVEAEALYARTTSFMTCIPETPDDAWVVEWVATVPAQRGHGHVKQLLGAILEEGRRQGYGRAQIAVLIGNVPAQKAYEGAGFAVVDEKTHEDFEREYGTPGIRRMLRAL
jgi:ribosomal protein S18 acetylase RimI-like enzyme